MNYKRLILVLTALAFFFSCNVREESLPLARRVSFQAVVADNPSSKTVLLGDGSVYWSPMDSISLFCGELGVQLIADNTEPVATATFSGALDGFLPDGTSEFWAVYPYDYKNTFDGQAITLVLPDKQVARAGTYAPGLFPSMARSTDYTLQFYNLCGGVKFSVAGEGIESVVFKGNNGEILAGQVQAAFDAEGKPLVTEVVKGVAELQLDAPEGGFEVGKWYYIVSLPVTLSAGYTMTFLSNNEVVAERSTTDHTTIKRSIWGRLTEADNVSQPDNEIWYTSTNGEVVQVTNPNAFEGVEIVSNTYANGKGIIRFNQPVGKVVNSAFTNCETLETLSLPNSLEMTFKPFALCPNLSALYGQYASDDNRFWIVNGELFCFAPAGATTVTVPEGVHSLAIGAFTLDNTLTEVILPSTLKVIGPGVFVMCTKLSKLTLPKSVNEIGYNAFASSAVDHLTVLNPVPPKIGETIFGEAYDGLEIYVPSSSLTAYKTAEGWSEFADYIFPIEGGDNYLTFISEGTTTLSLVNKGDNAPVFYYYSHETETWTLWDYSELTFTADKPLFIYGDNPEGINSSYSKYSRFSTSGSHYSVSGDIMSLLDKNNDISVIPSEGCFYSLFESCSGLTSAPELPATTLTKDCYARMFIWCINLTTAPELPATSLAESCYDSMFYGCTSLTVAPSLPATTLVSECYRQMFQECSGLQVAPELPAKELALLCYDQMFLGCTSLTTAPELPATNLASNCYYSMFSQCTSLESAPVLPATTMTHACYGMMFRNCTSLTIAPELPATTLDTFCYSYMFDGCSSLVNVPALPVTILKEGVYEAMFQSCTSLTEAPVLPASQLTSRCYQKMFSGCEKLERVWCMATDISAENCLTDWMDGVASSGTFIKAPDVQWPTGASGIPEGWTVEDAISANNYLTFTSQGTSSVYLSSVGGGAQPVLYYSYDSIIWESWDYSMLTFTADTPLYLCGDNPEGFSFDVSAYSTLGLLGDKCTVSGDVMSLLDKDEELTEIPTPYCFAFLFGGDSLVSGPDLTATTLTSGCYYGMFQGNKGLTSAPALPAVTLAENCYANMFYGCTGLTAAPELPAATLASSCYANMFNGCTGLTSAPSLSATELAYRCYYGMFQDCASLLAAPSLPATTMAEECYYTMFQGCSKLETAPELSATTLATGCYMGMFSTCTSLTEAPELPAITLAASCYYNMFAGCTKLVTAPELPATTLEYSCYAGMFSGCTSLTEAPVLPAQSLENMCYASLFTGCTSLNYVKCLATENMGGSNTGGWLSNVAATGTFVKAPNAQWESGMSGIPEGWEVVDDDGTSNSGHEGTDQGDEHLWG